MCGRYSLTADISQLARRFEFDDDWLSSEATYNIAPTQQVLIVREGGEDAGRRATYMRWGLIPSWAKDLSIGNRMINARAETVAERPAFRTALRRRRCLVLADGYYEWRRDGRSRTPFRVTLASGEPFAFAGLWETWQDPAGQTVPSCTIITTAANEILSPIHDRMPVILPRESETLWLDHDVQDTALLAGVLAPYPAEGMDTYQVSSLVNSTANNCPELAERMYQGQLTLGLEPHGDVNVR